MDVNKLAVNLTWDILAKLRVPNITKSYLEIFPYIYSIISKTYVQARRDEQNNVEYLLDENENVHTLP